jgi:DHA2 family multidrug resistance protein-like MFS transporter
MLVLSRVMQGFGAAGLMSVNTALIRFIYPRAMLGRGIGTTALVVATSSATGPTVASAILSVASWQWLFAVNVPIGLLALFLSLRSLPATARSPHPFDMPSAVLSALTFGLLITGLDGIGHGQGAALVAVELLGAVLVGIVLVRRQDAQASPLLPVDLFRRPIFALSVATSVCSFAAQGLAYVSLPFYLQDVLGRSQVETGLLMTPWPLTVAFAAPIAGRLSDRYPAGILGGLGLTALCIGLGLIAFLPDDPSAFDIIWRTTICGFGFGMFQSPNNRTMISSAPRERTGSAGGVLSTARLLGQTTGAVIVAVIFSLVGTGEGGASHGATTALLVGAGFAAAAATVSLLRLFDFKPGSLPEEKI